MNKKTNLIGGAILIAVIMFVIGYTTSNLINKSPRTGVQNPGVGFGSMNGGDNNRAGGQNTARRTNFGGGINGTIASINDQGFTLSVATSGSAIILTSPETKMEKRVEIGRGDFKIGDTVMVIGQKNTDGSYTAQSVSLGNTGFAPDAPNKNTSTPPIK